MLSLEDLSLEISRDSPSPPYYENNFIDFTSYIPLNDYTSSPNKFDQFFNEDKENDNLKEIFFNYPVSILKKFNCIKSKKNKRVRFLDFS
ncbi:hypothetical protein Mgra_00009318 [Meloidogyne graminicola]|uniref:Uncharacterized protein n=1 Tax=Meloidogyne graminicola TaxID=189291 RepID=A0A8S9ZA50_9BILA|nr:hypothetical protein Mgra_00009318 [Meloidogyne graminicola]